MARQAVETLTVARDHLLSYLEGARVSGLDMEALLLSCDVAPQSLESPVARFSYSSLIRLRIEICRLLNDENAGFLERPAPWGSTTFMCRALITSRTLREVLLRYQKYTTIMNDEVKVTFEENESEASIGIITPEKPRCDLRTVDEQRLFFLVSLSLWITARRFVPKRIHFAFEKPSFADDYSHVIPTQFVFEADQSRLVLDTSLMREPVRQSPRRLNEFLVNHLYYLIQENLAIGSVGERIRRVLTASMASNITLETLSSSLSIPTTTLRRRLKAEGLSFQALKDEARKARALHFLTEKHLTVAETAELTGFSDPASFSRAFKSWTGQAPGSYSRSASFSSH
jgi:AraC-like DNA-binding protein